MQTQYCLQIMEDNSRLTLEKCNQVDSQRWNIENFVADKLNIDLKNTRQNY